MTAAYDGLARLLTQGTFDGYRLDAAGGSVDPRDPEHSGMPKAAAGAMASDFAAS